MNQSGLTAYSKITLGNIVHIDPLQDVRWDRFVENHPLGLIYHLSAWKKVLEKSFKHMKGHHLALIDLRTNMIQAALPIFEVKSWLTGNKLVSIPFSTLSDPLISSSEQMNLLLQAVFDLSKKLRIPSIELRTFQSSPLIQDTRLVSSALFNLAHLSLDSDLEKLKRTFKKRNREIINKTQRGKLRLKVADSESDLNNFYCMYVKTRKRLSLPPQPYLFLKSLWDTLHPLNMIDLLFAEVDGQPVAGLINYKFKDNVSAEYEAWDRQANKMNPVYFLIWETIKIACHEGYKSMDLGRTSISNTNLLAFKKRWGAKITELHNFYYPEEAAQKMSQRETSLRYKIMQNMCKIGPDILLRYIGNFSYRHMG
jgi:CelD/BcsL family acetyltransferase involved in cellulose biosynthesis